jgi:hypothetical protein
MTTFTVILEGALNGSAVMSTRDDVDATTADDAEALAVAAWRELRPELRFVPLLTVQRA